MATASTPQQTFSIALSGLRERTTDYSAQLFTQHITSKDVGYVTSNVHVPAFLHNGSSGNVAVASIDSSESGGISFSGFAESDIIPALESVGIIFNVTKYGPLEFSAEFLFGSSCELIGKITITGTRPLISTDQPLPITLNDAIAEAYAEPSPENTYYDTLEFVDTVGGGKIQVVHSDEDLETPQGTFLACKFGCKHPETEGGVVGVMQITVDFLPRDAQRWLMETCMGRGQVTVYWRQYLGDNMEPDAFYPVPLNITSVEQTSLGVTANASFPMLTAMKFPRRLMTTSVLPGGLT